MKSQLSELNTQVKNIVEKWASSDILVRTAKSRMILLFRNADQVVVCSRRMDRRMDFTAFHGNRNSVFQSHGV